MDGVTRFMAGIVVFEIHSINGLGHEYDLQCSTAIGSTSLTSRVRPDTSYPCWEGR